MKVENELVDLIDELLERDAGAVNSTIIGELPHPYPTPPATWTHQSGEASGIM